MVNMDDETHPISPNWQWMCCVHVPLPVIARLSVSKDLHLEVPHHGVHHLPAGCKNKGKGDIDAAFVFLHLMPLERSESLSHEPSRFFYLLTLRGRFSGLMSIS